MNPGKVTADGVRAVLSGDGLTEIGETLASSGQAGPASRGFRIAPSGSGVTITFEGEPPAPRTRENFLAAYQATLTQAGYQADLWSGHVLVTARRTARAPTH